MRATERVPSPAAFRRWGALSALGIALERRVWSPSRSASRRTYPNLFVSLTGISGSGKTEAITIAKEVLSVLDDLHIAPDDMTKAGFTDAFEEALRVLDANGAQAEIYHAMAIISRELGDLLPAYDLGFLSKLSDLFDNPPTASARRRSSKSAAGNLKVVLERPTLNILCGVTPRFLSDLLPEVAWGQGFCSRMIFIEGHREEEAGVDVLRARPATELNALKDRIQQVFQLRGEFEWSAEAHAELNAWFNAGMPPVPEHSRLREYNTRRLVHVLKLAMLSAVSRANSLGILLEDFERAQGWLLEAEAAMPDIFRAMGAKPEMAIIRDLHYYLYTEYMSIEREKRKALPERMLWTFLQEKVESNRIPYVLASAKRMGLLSEPAPGQWVPVERMA